MSVEHWTDPAFVAEVHAWLRDEAAHLGLPLTGDITQPYVQPWSTVFRAATQGEALFLKACGPSQAHEPALTALLADCSRPVAPTPLAVHPREPWMLLADGGMKLEEQLTR